MEDTLTRIEKKVRWLQWMMGVNIALNVLASLLTWHLLCQVSQRWPQP